ncbi:MAG TPA: porin [Opitutaceae bacterium]|nr:porin [Opitutaceae bacterium]
MRTFLPSLRPALGLLSLLIGLPALRAQNRDSVDTEIQALRAQIEQLDAKLRVLERKNEIRDEAAAAAAPATPRITINDRGFALASADGANSIKLRGLVQLDSRLFFGDGGGIANNSFVLRRARLVSEGTFARNYSFQLVSEFGGSAVSIQDANFGINVAPALQLKFGKFKSPVGLELLQSDSWTFFNERSIVTNLVPNRDLGVQASGDLLNGRLSYALGVFGGVPDGGSTTNADFDNEKDVAGRLIAAPFKNEAGAFLQGLSFGVSGSLGREKSTAGRTGGYKTDGQQTFFSYAATTVADGQNWRVSPQLDFRNGSFGLLGEYVASTVNVRPSATGAKVELRNTGWQFAAGYVLTGEASSYAGVVPAANFDPAAGTWGAFEVVGRCSTVNVDDATFPVFASALTNANVARAAGVGLNWYLSKAVAFKIDYYQTRFGFNFAAPAVSATQILRQDEKTFITRFQLAF